MNKSTKVEKKQPIIRQAEKEYRYGMNVIWNRLLKKHNITTEEFSKMVMENDEDECQPTADGCSELARLQEKVQRKYRVYIIHEEDYIEIEEVAE